ncbi:FadR/GntR family transcriptional regulator [Evansella vedderi]|nr:FadR/GntR family transcriptional regulator [Evansella vedderi]
MIRRQKIYEIVANKIKEKIKNGELKPGDKLETVEQMAKSYGVGRSAIREALTTLRGMGLIEMKQGEGTFVKEYDYSHFIPSKDSLLLLDKKELRDLFEVRKILETSTAFIAAQNRNKDDLTLIKNALDKMTTAVDNEEQVERADVEFHLAIAEATHNSFLIELMHHISDALFSTMRESRRFWQSSEKLTLQRLYLEHESIYHAIVDQNSELAKEIMQSHLEKVKGGLHSMEKDEQ